MVTLAALALLLCTSEPPHAEPAPAGSPAAPFAERVKAERQAWSERYSRIREELAALAAANGGTELPADHWARVWAGTYQTIMQPGGAQGELLIAPASGAAFVRHRARQEWSDHAEITGAFPGGVSLKWAIEPRDAGDSTLGSRMHFMTWGDKRVMISEPSLVTLCNDLNEGGDGVSVLPSLYQRVGADGQLPRSAMERPVVRPELPTQWRACMFDQRVEFPVATATALEHADEQGRRRSDFRVTLDAGSERGVFTGMSLPFQRGTASGRLVIDKVDATTSEGVLRVWSLAGSEFEAPRPGAKFVAPGTRLPPAK